MKMTFISDAEEPNSMSAMTDVVFLLLIFFIVTMSSYVEMTLLETNLPTSGSASTTQVDLQKSLKIDVTADGTYLVNGIPQSSEIPFLIPIQQSYMEYSSSDLAGHRKYRRNGLHGRT